MSMHLNELYQEVILDHNRDPRNHYVMEHASAHAAGFNPLCGDKVDVYLKIHANQIEAASFKGCGCAISQASASLMTEMLQGKTVGEAEALFKRFHHMMTSDEVPGAQLDKLTVLAGARLYPARVKCATLAWHTLEAALHQQAETVTTEDDLS